MAPPPKGAPPKGSQTISSFFQRVERPPPPVSSSSSQARSPGHRPAPSEADSEAPPKRARLANAAPASQSLEQWRYVRSAPSSNLDRDGDQTANSVEPAPADTQPADPHRHARFVKLLYASSRLDRDRDYGYLSTQTRLDRHSHGGNGVGPSTSTSSSYFAPRQPEAAEQEEGHVGAQADDAVDDENEPQLVSSLSKFAHGAASRRSSSAKGGRDKGKAKAHDAEDSTGITYTPLEKQILELKREHPGVLLIIEVGYKLKFYGDDARIASRELNIACFPEKHLLTAMIPVHRLHVHIRKLITAGYKVGVVRQTETRALKAVSTNKSQPFTRELTAMYTASTWIDDLESGSGPLAGAESAAEAGMEEPTAQRSVVCVLERPEGGGGSDERVSIGLVSVSVATGNIVYDQFVDANLRSELETRIAHLNPAELLLPDRNGPAALSKQTEQLLKFIADQSFSKDGRSAVRIERFSDGKLSQNEAVRWLEDFFTSGPSTTSSSKSTPHSGRSRTNRQSMPSGPSTSDGRGKDSTIPVVDSEEEGSPPGKAIDSSQAEAASVLPTIFKLPHLCLISLARLVKHLSAFFSLTSVFSQPTNFTTFQNRTSMLLTANTIQNLDIFQNATDGRRKGSLIWLLDRCKTMMGRRLLRRWVGRPLTDLEALQARVDAVEELGRPDASIGAKLASMLQGSPDLERGLAKLNYGTLSPSELATVLLALNRITHEFGDVEDALDVGTRSSLVNDNVALLPATKNIVKRSLAAISVAEARKGNKKDLFQDAELYPDIQDSKDNILVIESELQEHLKEVRKQLKRPKLDYISVAGNDFLIEVRTADATKVPADWLRMSATKSMVRFHTPQVRQLLQEREQHVERLEAAANAAFKAFLETIKEEYTALRNTVAALATLDALLSLVQVAQLPGYSKPTFNQDNITRIEGLRHPMSEQLTETDFVPNDVVLGDAHSDRIEERASTILLTGSNMGGKSSIARATALVSILAQIGSFVPADSANVPLHDAILTRMGASDMLTKGRSTFMVEVVETADIIRAATPRSLVIIDELGRGTSTYDGLAIAHAVLEYLVLGDAEEGGAEAKRPQMFFITHHFQLCELEALARYQGRVRNMHMAVLEVAASSSNSAPEVIDEDGVAADRAIPAASSEPQIVFLYRLRPGPASKSLGINCARLAGLPQAVLEHAASKSAEMEAVEEREVEARRSAARLKLLRKLFAELAGERRVSAESACIDEERARATTADVLLLEDVKRVMLA